MVAVTSVTSVTAVPTFVGLGDRRDEGYRDGGSEGEGGHSEADA